MHITTTRSLATRSVALAATGAFALLLGAAPAGANSNGNSYPDDAQYNDQAGDNEDYNTSSNEEIEVTAPRSHQRGEYGAPIRDVAMSRPVRFDDLDLRTAHGAHLLRARIRSTAQNLCRELESMHPVAAPDNQPCYPNAVNDAMAQADDAIAYARQNAMNE